MESKAKRIKYVSTSSEDEYEDHIRRENNMARSSFRSRSDRRYKSESKNARLARENRLRKKMYMVQLETDVTSLRSENQKLSSLVDNQSCILSDLRKEVKYLKSIIANSSDICKLVRNINQSSGMSVSSSLDESLSLKNVYVPKPKQPVSRKVPHPWEEAEPIELFSSYAPESDYLSSPNERLFEDLDVELFKTSLFSLPNDIFKTPQVNVDTEKLEEHNYTLSHIMDHDNAEDVGVCLHVSKHHVSLEFCSTCSEKAHQSRDEPN